MRNRQADYSAAAADPDEWRHHESLTDITYLVYQELVQLEQGVVVSEMFLVLA